MRLARNQQLAIVKWNKDNNVQKNVQMSLCKNRKYNTHFSKRKFIESVTYLVNLIYQTLVLCKITYRMRAIITRS